MSLGLKEMIEEACQEQGFTVQDWDTDNADGLTAKLGQYEVVTPEYEDDGIFEGDSGELTACVVGAAKYNNQRVAFCFTGEGMDGGNEVSDLSALDSVA